ncbi:MAG: hypothetical protein L3J24_06975, partial [Xanthomonadales bacterium]|nr:hypothetical protein [Xanthomonadales bacterium]
TEITELLAGKQINLHSFSGDVVGSSAVFKFVPVDYEAAYLALQDADYQVIAHRNLVVWMEDKPGALARLSRRMSDAGITARGVHIVGHQGDCSLVAVEVKEPKQARELLADILV